MITTSCQKTPDSAIVVYKGEGLPSGAIIDAVSENQIKEIDAPAYWSEIMERMDGHITIEADVDVSVPEISNTPVLEMEQTSISDEQLQQLVEYFTQDYKAYYAPPMTKAQLEQEKKAISNKDGYFAGADEGFQEDLLERVDDLLEVAPYQNEQKEYFEGGFTIPMIDEYEYVWRNEQPEGEQLSVEYALNLLVETGEKTEPMITATNYNNTVGSNSMFTYEKGTCKSETYIKGVEDGVLMFDSGITVNEEYLEKYKEYTAKLKMAAEDIAITPEQAQEEAEKLLLDLNITNMPLGNCEKGVQLYYESWDLFDIDMSLVKGGYTLTYYRELQGLSGYEHLGELNVFTTLPEEVYRPPFEREVITVFVTEDGVQLFKWANMAQVSGVVAGNTKLLPFSEIKEKFADHIYYANIPPKQYADAVEYMNIRYVVDNVLLQAGYISAYEEPDKVWMVPVWVFEVQYFSDETFMLTKTVVINAIDGGYVSVGKNT